MGEKRDFFKSLRALISDFLEVSPDETQATDTDTDGSLDSMKAALGRAVVFHRTLTKERNQLASVENAAEDAKDKADFAIRHGRDDLARAAIAEAREKTTRLDDVDRILSLLTREITALENLIAAHETGGGETAKDAAARTELLAELDRLMTETPPDEPKDNEPKDGETA